MQDITKLTNDKEFRQKLILNPRKYVLQLGLDIPVDIEIIVKTNTKNVIYMPVSVNMEEIDMLKISAAVKASTAGSIGTAGTVSSVTATIGSSSSASSIGTMGSH